MSLIVLERASLSFGGQTVLEDASLNINDGDRLGLVGPNGSGKSTLLRVLMGQQGLDGGRAQQTRGVRVGYLPQDVLETAEGTLLASVLASVPGRGELEQKLERARRDLERTDDPEQQLRLARRLSELGDRLEHFERYYDEHLAMRILKGLGFGDDQHQRPLQELSGGWKMRAALAGLLFQQPDVLFLDEPTNHLDLPSVLWLDEFLAGYRNALVLVCHDRQFFNRHVQKVVSLEPEGLRFYPGDYDDYVEARAAEEELLEAENLKRERKIKELERFVAKNRAQAPKARQAQSRVKQMERLLREMEQPIQRPRRLRFQFPPTERTGKEVLVLSGVDKSFGELRLYRGLTRTIRAGERVAIIGANGKGKSTLLKLMAGEMAPDAGQIKLGSGVKPGYFAQHHTEQLDPRRTVLEEVWSCLPTAGESQVKGICGAFLFSGDDVDKAIGVLSGGERARVLLARLMINPGNLLLLDEPTTHLDVHASEALVEALRGYDGTLVFVSHNTTLLDRLPTRIWDLAREGEITEYPGTLEEYLEHQQRRRAAEAEPDPDQPGAATREGGSREERKQRKRLEARRRNELARLTRRVRDEIAELEQQIDQLEQEKERLEPRLADPELYSDPEQARATVQHHKQLGQQLDALFQRWEQAQAELERVTESFESQE